MANVRLDDWSKGLVATEQVSEDNAPLGTLRTLKNASVNRGDIRTPSYLDLLVELPDYERITGYFKDDINGGHIIAGLRDLYHYQEGKPLRVIKKYAFNGEGRPSFSLLNGKLFVCAYDIFPFVLNIDPIEEVSLVDLKGNFEEWKTYPPFYSFVWQRRVWLILKDANQLWASTLDDASDWTINPSAAADSANVFISDTKSNAFKSIIEGLGSLLVFKREGMSIVKNLSPGQYDINNYRFLDSYSTVSTHNAFSTVNVLDEVYSLGAFGLQKVAVESLTNNIKLTTVANHLTGYFADALERETQYTTLLSADDGAGLYMDLQGQGERSFVRVNIGKDALDQDITYSDLRALGKTIDYTTNVTRYVLAHKNQVWLTRGSQAYPEPLSMVVESHNHPIAKGNVFKTKPVMIQGEYLDEVEYSYFWNNGEVPSDKIQLWSEDNVVAKYDVSVYDVDVYAGQETNTAYNRIPMYGQGHELRYRFDVQNCKPGVRIKSLNMDVTAYGGGNA